MQKYIVSFEDGNAVVCDENGVVASSQAVHLIVRRLIKSYPLKCYVYLGHDPVSGLWKIGMSRNVARRMEQLNTTITHVIECPNALAARRAEKLFHALCAQSNVRGEWFNLDDNSVEMIKVFATYESLFRFIDANMDYFETGDKAKVLSFMDGLYEGLSYAKILALCELGLRHAEMWRRYIEIRKSERE